MELKMKKTVLLAAIGAAFSLSAQADTKGNAADHAQARPASTVNAEVTTVTETTAVQGNSVAQAVAVSEPVAVTEAISPEAALPAAAKVDDADLEKTMKTMGKNFKSAQQGR